ncbi:hypothetical protein [Magnetospira sp. QH-2]|uniref:hypothetical protein n=1 Tax=Magnetospira sp. (strain QH-2) TaxID=1288970 RepID=UPI0003E81447|nr:hypothetical protein [Magnetospira sp. QH-2]CCQ72333.1 protein of unknown function [Magnetospira sp. QH-2]
MQDTNLRDYVLSALGHLSWSELDELDEAITPRVAELLSKAFGPQMRQLLAPLIAGER